MMIASGLFGGPLSPEQIARLTLRHADLVHSAALPQVEWMFLNIRRPPFDDVRVRRALNYAVDRGHIVELAGGPELAQPTCQGLAPGLPGYESYCPYTLDPNPAGTWSSPDLAKAQRLIAASGTAGAKVTVWTPSEGERPAVARYFVSLLDQLGYRSSLRRFSGHFEDEYFPTVADASNGAQIGQIGWALDYLAPANFLQPTLTCAAFNPDDPFQNANVGAFCDADIDSAMDAALTQAIDDPVGANAAWTSIDRELVDAAPFVSMFNRRERHRGLRAHPKRAAPSLLGRARRPTLGAVTCHSRTWRSFGLSTPPSKRSEPAVMSGRTSSGSSPPTPSTGRSRRSMRSAAMTL